MKVQKSPLVYQKFDVLKHSISDSIFGNIMEYFKFIANFFFYLVSLETGVP